MREEWWGLPTERVRKLRQGFLDSRLELCIERAKIVTESYKSFQNQPAIILRALTLSNILENMTINIYENELIVGGISEKRRGGPVFPEMATYWLEKELDTIGSRDQDAFLIRDVDKEVLREQVFPFWKNRTLYEKLLTELPGATRRTRESGVFNIGLHEEGGLGHVLLDFEALLKTGFGGIRQRIENRLNQLDLADPASISKVRFLKAAAIVAQSATRFIERYAILAENRAAKTSEQARREELLRIAGICRHVSEKPAESFYEALQMVFFAEIIPQIETNGPAVSLGRFDRYLYPYYRKDIDQNAVTRDGVQELIDCFWIKINEIVKVYKEEDAHIHAGFPMNHNLTIGGRTSEGMDATNDLTFMSLAAHAHVHLIQPNLSVRLHKTSTHELIDKVARVIKLGGGMPQVVNDEAMIPALLNKGISISDARNYAIIGCVEPSIVGIWGRTNGGYFNLTKVLEYALNGGRDRLTGSDVGLPTPTQFQEFGDVVQAYRHQMAHIVRHLVVENNLIDVVHAEIMPEPFVSILVPDCIEKASDVTSGGARVNWTGPLGVGVANVGDSLIAVKTAVFEKAMITFKDLTRLLDQNFEGNEETRLMFQNQMPKYGNDNDSADLLARKSVDIFCDEIEKYRNPRGGVFVPSLIPVASNIPLGWITGATPDGRKAKTPLADGVSPAHGADRKGPTAVLRSVAKLDHTRITNGIILNQKFSPALFETDAGVEQFVAYLRSFVDLGIQHLQINVVDTKTLMQAQKHPSEYRDLVVRVAGYSALFNELSKDVQNDIIERTEQGKF